MEPYVFAIVMVLEIDMRHEAILSCEPLISLHLLKLLTLEGIGQTSGPGPRSPIRNISVPVGSFSQAGFMGDASTIHAPGNTKKKKFTLLS